MTYDGFFSKEEKPMRHLFMMNMMNMKGLNEWSFISGMNLADFYMSDGA